ncbi:HAD-like domain-containing protein [Helicostylum pulchrum]|uniref:Haloacid dehalogenase-like hydrolase n=1 Tax=Helicostylum pulchrum TaxID=562976 RepID=A0ABP9YBB3_9FUNG|nr:HAD-like domain-containing protein [Helicostylum pulchrum]
MSSLQQLPLITKLPLILVDFDQTITKHDTIAPLGQFGVAQSHNQKPWSYFVDGYLNDYRTHRNQLDHLPNDCTFNDFVQQLNTYKPIEKSSLARVSKHKVFQGLSKQAIKEKAIELSQTELRSNVISTLKPYKEQVRIVSLNWSKDWILGFLNQLGLESKQVYSNDLTFMNDICTGDIIPQILTTGDKQQLINESIRANHGVIYIGDSLGDIEPLAKSNIGIVIGNDLSLIKTLNDFGYTVQEDTSKSSHLYHVDNWHQIKTILDKYYHTI